MKTGILITNLGTPDAPTPAAVRRYLRQFLSDPRVIEIPRFVWWPILYGFILPTRPRQSAKLYQKIWTENGSPLLSYSRSIAENLQQHLDMPVVLGMSYGNPSIESALEELRVYQVERIVVLPLYPQYSATTTAATFDEICAVLKKWRNLPELRTINQYATDAGYIDALCQSIKTFREVHGASQHLLFSFHGIPERNVKKGDPYAEQCRSTASLLAKALKLDNSEWTIAFQSRLGRAKWLEPYTDKVLEAMPHQGITDLQVVCPGFAVDCLETLEEIAIRGKEQFLESGGKSFKYIPALNDGSAQIGMLANLIKRYL